VDDAADPVRPTVGVAGEGAARMGQVLSQQGDVALLQDPIAETLLQSRQPVRFAYTWRDGTPRVVAMWFHWDGRSIVMATPVGAPKLKVLRDRPEVAIVIDDAGSFPYRELTIRGRAELQPWEGVVPEYALAAKRYFGEEQGAAWVATVQDLPQVRIAVTPTWVGLIDFEDRMPSALG
jgi:hypothetical protein